MKRIEKLTLFCFFNLIVLSSCKKENNDNWTELNIHCVNPFTSEPVDLVYFSIRGTTDTWPDPFDYHGNFYPTNGHFTYSFKAKNRYQYELYYPENNYYNIGEKDLKIKKGEVNDFTIPMTKYGHLQLFTENLDCIWTDSLYWKIIYLDDPDLRISDYYWTHAYDGCYGYQTPISKGLPSGHYQFKWKLKEGNGTTSSGEEGIWVPEDDTTVFEFLY